MSNHWRSRSVEVTVPERVLRRVWKCARRSFGTAGGGLCDARSASTMLLWSHPLNEPVAKPVVALSVDWSSPVPGYARIGRLSWLGDRENREAQLWRTLEELAGADWPGLREAGAEVVGSSHAA